jgi:hypothetical protein
MQNTVISAIMAALLASTLMPTNSVAAEGDYYQGADPHAGPLGQINLFQTNSVRYGFPLVHESRDLGKTKNSSVDSGDYYEGATRPH